MFNKRREILFDKKDLQGVIEVLNKNGLYSISIGNCGWKKAPNAMFVFFSCNNKKYINVLRNLKEGYHVDILPETVGY